MSTEWEKTISSSSSIFGACGQRSISIETVNQSVSVKRFGSKGMLLEFKDCSLLEVLVHNAHTISKNYKFYQCQIMQDLSYENHFEIIQAMGFQSILSNFDPAQIWWF